MSYKDNLLHGAMHCNGGDPSGEQYESSVNANGCKEIGSGSAGAGGGGLPTGGAPWQQLVTGADGVARWEPRLAYAETEEAVILPETTLLTAEGNFFHYLMQPFSADIAEGMVCTVNYNGTEYKCSVEKVYNGDGTSFLALGNIAAMKEEGNTGEPFVLMAVVPPELASQGIYAQLIPFDEAESVTISITGVAEKVKTIDPKFLPAGAGGGASGVIYAVQDSTSSSYIAYSDEAHMTQLTYEQGKAIAERHFWIGFYEDGMTVRLAPFMMVAIDDEKKIHTSIYWDTGDMSMNFLPVTLIFSDSVTG